jgi:hypothetical protein
MRVQMFEVPTAPTHPLLPWSLIADGNCAIVAKSKQICKKCRYDKCVGVGMDSKDRFYETYHFGRIFFRDNFNLRMKN